MNDAALNAPVPSGSATEPFSAGAVSRQASLARKLIEKYYEDKGKPISKMKDNHAARILVDKLNFIAREAHKISELPPDEQSNAFGQFVAKNQTMVTQSLIAAYIFAQGAYNGDKTLSDSPDNDTIPRADLESLARGLIRSLDFAGQTYGELNMPGAKASVDLRGNGPSALIGNFETSVGRLISGMPTTAPEVYPCKFDALKTYLEGFKRGLAKAASPLIKQFDAGTPCPG